MSNSLSLVSVRFKPSNSISPIPPSPSPPLLFLNIFISNFLLLSIHNYTQGYTIPKGYQFIYNTAATQVTREM